MDGKESVEVGSTITESEVIVNKMEEIVLALMVELQSMKSAMRGSCGQNVDIEKKALEMERSLLCARS